jgi:endonuclease/exonuclease/phosphatase family metal-dependent hydrolase
MKAEWTRRKAAWRPRRYTRVFSLTGDGPAVSCRRPATPTRSSPIKTVTIHFVLGCLALGAVLDISPVVAAQTRTLRVVTYNIEADTDGYTAARPGLIAPPANTNNVQAGGVLEGIGEEILGSDPARPLDVLALQETTSNPITVTPIVNALNSFYNAPGMYAMSSYQATESGGFVASGNGPNALVYNTKTLQLLASVPVDPPGGINNLGSNSGEYREVMRYELAPAGMTPTATNEFYIYVSHYKSGIQATDLTARNGEAKIIRNDEANNLPANARVLYVGDYNVTSSGEAGYQTILSNTAPNGIHQGQGIDPMNVTGATNINWGTNTAPPSILTMETESSTYLRYRDDLQVMTTNVYFGVAGGLALVPGTYHVFGNNGTTPYYGSVNSGSNTALNNRLVTNGPVYISASQLYLDLTTASDHLPVVADYTIPITVPAPVFQSVTGTGGAVRFTWSAVASVVYQLQYRTNLAQGNWSNLGSAITATNAVMSASDSIGPDPQRFYRLLVP